MFVSDSVNCIGFRTEYTGLGLKHPCIILLFKEVSLINLKYVYTEVAFDGEKLEDGVL